MGFDPSDAIAFGKSTHELVYRLITSLSLASRPRIVTTQSEFHSLRRQLTRLAEEGVPVEWVASRPREELADRVLEALTPGTAMLAMSAVLFDDAYVVPRLGEIIARAAEIGAIVLIDGYHAFNVVPLEWGAAKAQVFAVAGGYKYAEFGEGLCWMRIPEGCTLRPVYTGWFADFGALARPQGGGVGYAQGGARFAGATFDPTAIYRAEAVLAHFDRFGLTVERLRAISLRQTRRILGRMDARGRGGDVLAARDDARRGGFVTVRVSDAEARVQRLRARGVLVDARGETLRLGPAPYLTDDEIDRGTDAVIDDLIAHP
jgi:selenocysteine lyase/cysteine desulfurase